MQAQAQYARLNSYHGPKKQVLGNQAGRAAPAWRTNPVPGKRAAGPLNAVERGSKILMSHLPPDVGEAEVENLFKKTVGPLKESFLVYNSQGRSKGMAVVTFQRTGDATVARAKYNNKIIDGRRPIKIEVVNDEDVAVKKEAEPPSLLQRLGATVTPAAPPAGNPAVQPALRKKPHVQAKAPRAVAPKRMKKGPKRIKKAVTTAAQLDKEMEDYRAHANVV